MGKVFRYATFHVKKFTAYQVLPRPLRLGLKLGNLCKNQFLNRSDRWKFRFFDWNGKSWAELDSNVYFELSCTKYYLFRQLNAIN